MIYFKENISSIAVFRELYFFWRGGDLFTSLLSLPTQKYTLFLLGLLRIFFLLLPWFVF